MLVHQRHDLFCLGGVNMARFLSPGRRSLRETWWRTAAITATFPAAVPENEEVVPVNALSTWVLPSGNTVGR